MHASDETPGSQHDWNSQGMQTSTENVSRSPMKPASGAPCSVADLTAILQQLRYTAEISLIAMNRSKTGVPVNMAKWNQLRAVTDGVLAQCSRLLQYSQLCSDPLFQQHFFKELSTFLAIVLPTLYRRHDLGYHRKIHIWDFPRVLRRRLDLDRPSYMQGFGSWAQFLIHGAPGAKSLLPNHERSDTDQRSQVQILPFGGLRLWWEWSVRLYDFAESIESLVAGGDGHTTIKPFPEKSETKTVKGVVRRTTMIADRDSAFRQLTDLFKNDNFTAQSANPQFINEQLYRRDITKTSVKRLDKQRHDTPKRGTFLHMIVQRRKSKAPARSAKAKSEPAAPKRKSVAQHTDGLKEFEFMQSRVDREATKQNLLKILRCGRGENAFALRKRQAATLIGSPSRSFSFESLRHNLKTYASAVDMSGTGEMEEVYEFFGSLERLKLHRQVLLADEIPASESIVDVAVRYTAEEHDEDVIGFDPASGEVDLTEMKGMQLLSMDI